MEYLQQITIMCVVGLSWARTISHRDQIDNAVSQMNYAVSTEIPSHLQEKEFTYLEENGFLPYLLEAAPIDKLEQEVEKAIVKFQQFYRLSPSGQMDNITKTTMWKPRCGFPDILNFDRTVNGTTNHRRKRYNAAGGFYKWRRHSLTYAIVNYPRRGHIKSWEVRTVIKRAFHVWSEVTPLVFKEAKEHEADIRIGFYSGRHSADKDHPLFDGPDGDLAHAFSPNAGWGKVDGDVHFDNDEIFDMESGSNGAYSFFQITAHEIGHALGLDHSDDPNALMWPHYHYMENFRLPQDDLKGIQHLYGTNPVNSKGPSTFNVDSLCNKVYDTIVSIGGIVHIFKGTRFWKVWGGRLLSDKEGQLIRDHWYRLPSKLDAVYQRKDGKTIFFKGTKYWVYYGQNPVSGYPRPVKELGIPNAIDAAVPIGSRKTFFFRKSLVWRYDEKKREIDRGYPKSIRQVFKGLPKRIRIAFAHNDGHSYFLKGIKYYRMTNRLTSIDHGYPREFGVDFMNCPSRTSLQDNTILRLEVDPDEQTINEDENEDEDIDSDYE